MGHSTPHGIHPPHQISLEIHSLWLNENNIRFYWSISAKKKIWTSNSDTVSRFSGSQKNSNRTIFRHALRFRFCPVPLCLAIFHFTIFSVDFVRAILHVLPWVTLHVQVPKVLWLHILSYFAHLYAYLTIFALPMCLKMFDASKYILVYFGKFIPSVFIASVVTWKSVFKHRAPLECSK